MRELTKAMFRFGCVMPLYGLKQMANLAQPREWSGPGRTSGALDAVSLAARDQLGEGLKQAFDAGDRLQEGIVDTMWSVVGLGGDKRKGAPATSDGGEPNAAGVRSHTPAAAGDEGGRGPVPSAPRSRRL